MKPFAIACKVKELLVLLEDMETKDKLWVRAEKCSRCFAREKEQFFCTPNYPEPGAWVCIDCL